MEVLSQYNKGPRGWQNVFAIRRFHYITALLPTVDVAMHKTCIKWAQYWKVESIYQSLCCFPSPSNHEFPCGKITSQKWLFNTYYCKIDLLNRNPIDQKLSACWRHPVPLIDLWIPKLESLHYLSTDANFTITRARNTICYTMDFNIEVH